MNAIYKSMLGAMMCLSVAGCSKFLEEKSQDEIKPSTVTDLEQLLMGEVYPAGHNDATFMAYVDMLTDDMQSSFNPAPGAQIAYKAYETPFTFRADMYEKMEDANVPNIDTYEKYFKRIKGCNVVLDYLDQVRGEEGQRENVRGQALAMRSYYYFMLVNLYGQPYNAAGVDRNTTPGVELVLKSAVSDVAPPRASVGAIYTQVEADLLQALPLVEKNGKNNTKFQVTDLFIHTLLSRMYLYMEKWDLAEKHASIGLSRNSSLTRLAPIAWPSWYFAPSTGVYSLKSVEAIWLGYGGFYEYYHMHLGPAENPVFTVSNDLRGKYEYTPSNRTNRGDLRMRFFYWYYPEDDDWLILTPYTGDKYANDHSNTYHPTKGMRVAELYLNRAEAKIMQYLKNGDEALRKGAVDDLNFLRSNRYDTRNVAYVPVDFSGETLLNFYRDERRRELSFEDHRWFDLRRYGMPEIRHTFKSSSTQAAVEYVLEKGSKRYVLPIPRSVLQRNPGMVANP